MKYFILTGLLLVTGLLAKAQQAPNTLTAQEKKDGWKLLFDGKTTNGWRGAYKDKFPAKGWDVTDGMLTIQQSNGSESESFGDIVTDGEYSDFDLVFDFKLTEGANSGVKYFVAEQSPKPKGSAFGLEFQVLDDDKHPDAKLGRNGNRTVGSLYDLIPASGKKANPIGEWNTGRVISKGKHVEHWLNGKKVVEYERGSEQFRELVAMSKYKAPEYNANGRFGEAPKGHILLQDHGNRVYFRNMKIKTL
ncbi:3-keto-disaccharide hydrolase [Spirosoma litoris]